MQKVMLLLLLSLSLIGPSYSDEALSFKDFDEDQNFLLNEKELQKLFIILKPNVIKKFKLKEKDFKYSKTLFLYQVINSEVDLTKNENEFLKYLSFDACFNLEHCKETYLSQIEIDQLNFEKTLVFFN